MIGWLWLWMACRATPEVVRHEASPPAPDAPTTVAVDEEEGDDDGGLFQRVRAQREAQALEALGYVDGAEPAPERSGVVRRAPHVPPGKMLWTSGHAPEAYLMDLDGRVLHTWRAPFETLFPDVPPSDDLGRRYFRRVLPEADGSLVVIFEGQGIARIDRDGRPIWAHRLLAHHDLSRLDDGGILTLTRKAHVNPAVNAKRPILEDYVAILSPEGAVVREVSVLEALLASPYAHLWAPRKPRGDLFHTNAVVRIDGRWSDRLPEWTEGRILVSVRAWHALLLIDLDRATVVWAHTGDFRRQHDPRLLDDTILLFDNLGLGDASRVIEIDPATGEVVWSYEGSPEAPFLSRFCGASSRLDDGATLITDSWQGRAFEAERDGTLRWEFVNPHRAGEQGELIAVIPEMIRLPPSWGSAWLR